MYKLVNVENFISELSVKYLYKYVYKGYNNASIIVSLRRMQILLSNQVNITEPAGPKSNWWNAFLDSFNAWASEGVWRIISFYMHDKYHSVKQLQLWSRNNTNTRCCTERGMNCKLGTFSNLKDTPQAWPWSTNWQPLPFCNSPHLCGSSNFLYLEQLKKKKKKRWTHRSRPLKDDIMIAACMWLTQDQEKGFTSESECCCRRWLILRENRYPEFEGLS